MHLQQCFFVPSVMNAYFYLNPKFKQVQRVSSKDSYILIIINVIFIGARHVFACANYVYRVTVFWDYVARFSF